jgi:hypothetical protein
MLIARHPRAATSSAKVRKLQLSAAFLLEFLQVR